MTILKIIKDISIFSIGAIIFLVIMDNSSLFIPVVAFISIGVLVYSVWEEFSK